jgi:hypothetical protein
MMTLDFPWNVEIQISTPRLCSGKKIDKRWRMKLERLAVANLNSGRGCMFRRSAGVRMNVSSST